MNAANLDLKAWQILTWEIVTGQSLRFTRPLPVAQSLIHEKESHLLKVNYLNKFNNKKLEIISEIPILDGYSFYSIDQLKLFQENKAATKYPEPLQYAFEVNQFLLCFLLNKNQFTFPLSMPIRSLDQQDRPFSKLKLSPHNFKETYLKIKSLQKKFGNKFKVDLDANLSMDLNDWKIFFKELYKFCSSDFINTIEEPVPFHILQTPEAQQLFRSYNIAIDESLPQWISQKVEYDDIIDRLRHYQTIIFKPGMLSVATLENFLKRQPLQIILSCLYEGPYNLSHFFYLYHYFQLSQPAGLAPLVNIQENLPYLIDTVENHEHFLTLTLK